MGPMAHDHHKRLINLTVITLCGFHCIFASPLHPFHLSTLNLFCVRTFRKFPNFKWRRLWKSLWDSLQLSSQQLALQFHFGRQKIFSAAKSFLWNRPQGAKKGRPLTLNLNLKQKQLKAVLPHPIYLRCVLIALGRIKVLEGTLLKLLGNFFMRFYYLHLCIFGPFLAYEGPLFPIFDLRRPLAPLPCLP